MSKEKAARVAAKKIKDKWKTKTWYTILANDSFGKKEIGSSPAQTPEDMIGRISEVSLSDVTGDFKQSHVKLMFRITKVEGDKAFTEFEGHEINQDYIRRMIRRRKTRIDSVVDVTTSDNFNLRVKPLLVVDRKIISGIETKLRNKVDEFVRAKAATMPSDQFIVYMFSPQISNDIYEEIKTIYPTRKIEIRKSEIIRIIKKQMQKQPEIEVDEEEQTDAGVA